MNKKTQKRLILWEGFRKELPWILFWMMVGMMAYGYYQDKQICDEVLADPCSACYKLNANATQAQTLTDKDYLNLDYHLNPVTIYTNVTLNKSLILQGDKNPNDRTISNLSF